MTDTTAQQFTPFEASLLKFGLSPLRARSVTTLQINLGRRCNMACRHCHVDAGPNRTELMGDEVFDRCLDVLSNTPTSIVDITGGAPELHPRYRELILKSRKLGKSVITRSNLTILLDNGFEELPKLYREHSVVITASLPYFREHETDAVRGKGSFLRSVEALRRLNSLGFGAEGSGLVVNLVSNPAGAFLPPPQGGLERQFRDELEKHHGVTFNNLFTITNMPIARFRNYLEKSGNYLPYVQRLVEGFNPGTVPNIMCRDLISVGWDGTLYDCDFNQMLALPINHGAPSHISRWDTVLLNSREIVTAQHCYGCTAGTGSSCGGQLSEQ